MASQGAFNKAPGVVTGVQGNLIDARLGINNAMSDNPIVIRGPLNFGQEQVTGFGAEQMSTTYRTTLQHYFTTPELGVPHLQSQMNTLVDVSGNAAKLYNDGAVTEEAAATYIHQSLDGVV